MTQTAAAAKRQQGWITVGWQGITLRVPEEWYPAALGMERASGYLRVQSADGPIAEVKWFTPRGTVDMDRELTKYRTTLEKAARKRRQTFQWRPKPKVSVRESRPEKNRRFFGWSTEGQGLGVIWYCRTCARVVIAQVTTPSEKDAALAATILSSIEDHGEDGRDLWSVYGLQVEVPSNWSLDKHQLMAGYTMLQFRRRDQMLRTERWALASIALKDATVQEFVRGKLHPFWKGYSCRGADAEYRGHAGAEFAGRTRKLWLRVAAPVSWLLKRPLAETIDARAWHCDIENKIFAVHAVHPRGDTHLLDEALESVVCHRESEA